MRQILMVYARLVKNAPLLMEGLRELAINNMVYTV